MGIAGAWSPTRSEWIPARSESDERVGSRRVVAAYGVVLFFASLLQTGYAVYLGHHAVQIPLVHLLNDPSAYPFDPFADALLSYASLFWSAVARGARLMPLGSLLALLFLVERALVLYAAARLARTIAPHSELAAIGAMTVFAAGIQPFTGNGTIVTNYTEHTGFAIPFVLLGIAAFYGRRPLAAAVWLGVAGSLNILYVVFTLAYLAAAWVLDREYRRAWLSWLQAAGVFLVVSGPIIVITATAFSQQAADSSLWYVAARARLAHHLFPLTWNKHDLVRQVALMALFLVVFAQRGQRESRLARHAVVWTAIGFGWLAYAFLAAYAFKVPALLVVSAGRAVDIWLCFASVVLVSVVASKVETSRADERLPWLAALAGSLLIWMPALSVPVVGLALVVLLWEPVRRRVIGATTQGVALVVVGCLLLVALDTGLSRLAARPRLVGGPPETIASVARWAQRNTPPDAVFLVDPNWSSFRALSQRPVFVTFSDGTAILWNRAFVGEWVARLRALGLDIVDLARIKDDRDLEPRLAASYSRLEDADVSGLRASGGVRYWVVSHAHSSNFPVVYRTPSSKVLEVR